MVLGSNGIYIYVCIYALHTYAFTYILVPGWFQRFCIQQTSECVGRKHKILHFTPNETILTIFFAWVGKSTTQQHNRNMPWNRMGMVLCVVVRSLSLWVCLQDVLHPLICRIAIHISTHAKVYVMCLKEGTLPLQSLHMSHVIYCCLEPAHKLHFIIAPRILKPFLLFFVMIFSISTQKICAQFSLFFCEINLGSLTYTFWWDRTSSKCMVILTISSS